MLCLSCGMWGLQSLLQHADLYLQHAGFSSLIRDQTCIGSAVS